MTSSGPPLPAPLKDHYLFQLETVNTQNSTLNLARTPLPQPGHVTSCEYGYQYTVRSTLLCTLYSVLCTRAALIEATIADGSSRSRSITEYSVLPIQCDSALAGVSSLVKQPSLIRNHPYVLCTQTIPRAGREWPPNSVLRLCSLSTFFVVDRQNNII
jgi:hypothetical protein